VEILKNLWKRNRAQSTHRFPVCALRSVPLPPPLPPHLSSHATIQKESNKRHLYAGIETNKKDLNTGIETNMKDHNTGKETN